MKTLLLLTLALWNVPIAHAETYYTCGCTNIGTVNAAYKNRANWEFRNAWALPRAKERALEACDARFGRGPHYGNCLPVKLEGKNLAKYERDLARIQRNDETGLRRQASRRNREREESYRNANGALDEVIRRNREDEIDRVLKEARECRMYGNCPGR